MIGGPAVSIAGIVVGGLNVGMCPPGSADQTNSGFDWNIPCDHTFDDSGIWIGATARLLNVAGLVILSAGAAIYVRFLRGSEVLKEK